MVEEERDWSSIHIDIGCLVLSKLIKFVDHVRFGAVCKYWHTIAADYYNRVTLPSRGSIPMLLVPVTECETQRRLYNVSAGKVDPNVTLFDIPNKRCCGSSFGWLAFVEEDLSVTIINPFKFKRNHHTSTRSPHFRVIFEDLVFHKGLVYATDARFMVVSIDINSQPPQMRILKGPEPFNLHEKWAANYIAESTSGDLYAIRRRFEFEDMPTKIFKVLKLEFHPESGDLIRYDEVNTLNGDAIFVGENYSVSFEASKFGGCLPNSIYFIDDFWIGYRHMSNEVEDSGIYNVREKRVSRHYERDPNHRLKPPAIWVQPSPSIS
uniref:KIB1-4 beta-propeller domain-containing protein n=1 Tax=Kalanchoe fedtschenkoi TaxID=63787 RepID=A0A7N0UDA8_KALFE